jgi:hypothetical protein
LTIKFTHEQILCLSLLTFILIATCISYINLPFIYLRLSIYSVVKYLFSTIVENKTLLKLIKESFVF